MKNNNKQETNPNEQFTIFINKFTQNFSFNINLVNMER